MWSRDANRCWGGFGGRPKRSRARSAADLEPEPIPLLRRPQLERGRLKAPLSRVYPERPRPEDQRLIYSGEPLLDHRCLRDLLPKQEKRHVSHLVCNVKSPSKMPETSAKVAEATEQPAGLNQGQYSGDSPSDGLRFLMVMGATVVTYLHHVGRFPFRQRPVQNFPKGGPLYEAVNQDPYNNLQERPDPEIEDPNHVPPDKDVLDGVQTSPSFYEHNLACFQDSLPLFFQKGPQP
uniref:Ubiquitin-like domain-containing protein n=1 Tax=Equus asinus TaxID=9793 RepID=A0A9L0K1G3_EQUAS